MADGSSKVQLIKKTRTSNQQTKRQDCDFFTAHHIYCVNPADIPKKIHFTELQLFAKPWSPLQHHPQHKAVMLRRHW
jgi:hypothetical protein